MSRFWPLHVRWYVKIGKFLHAMVLECILRVVTFTFWIVGVTADSREE